MRLLALLALAAAGSMAAMAQEDPYPVTLPAKKMEKRTVPKGQPQQPKGDERPADDREAFAAPNLDAHFLQKDEYLITLEAYKGGSGWARVFIAKMVTPASAETKQEAEFFVINGGKKGEKVWTKHFALTRPASREDLKLGTIAYALDAERHNGVYSGPASREDNLEHTWFVGTINDDSNLYKGYLTLSGYKVKPSALRVVVR